jgi:hypothetical protein
MEKYPGSDQACQNLLFNRQQLGRKLGIEESAHTPPANHYPHNHEADRLWRGPTWINTNWYIAERGLKKQIIRSDLSHRPDLIARCIEWDGKISKSSKNLLVMNGPCEHYDPITGRGQRRRVKNFAWSNLAYVM